LRFRRHGDNSRGDGPASGHGAPNNGPSGTSGTNGTNGAHPIGLSTRRISLAATPPTPDPHDEDETEPVDLVSVQADDALINALAAGLSVSTGNGHGGADAADADDEVAAILAAWKADVDATPIPDLIDVDEGVAAVRAATRPTHRVRQLAPIAAAAAFLVVTLAGVSVGSYSAQPTDTLWPVAKVLYSERTTSIEAADRAEQHITLAKQAIAAGQPAIAEKELAAASTDLAVVRPEEGKTELAAVQDFLVAKAAETQPGVPTDPGAPLTTDRGRTVPPGAAITAPSPSVPQPISPTDTSSTGSGSSTSTGEQSGPAPGGPEVAAIVPQAPAPASGASTAPTADSGSPPADDTTAPDSGTSSSQPDSSSSSSDPTGSSPAPVPAPAVGAADPGPDPLGAASDSAAPDAPPTS
jgi:hypothetical protein